MCEGSGITVVQRLVLLLDSESAGIGSSFAPQPRWINDIDSGWMNDLVNLCAQCPVMDGCPTYGVF